MPEKTAKQKISILDRAFPSLPMMGVLLLAALVLIGICGWKVITLDTEREEVGRERLLLERDRDAFLTYGGELPQMTERHRVLANEIATLESRKTFLEQTNNSLDEKQRELDARAARLTGAVAELQSRSQSLEETIAKERAEILRLRPEREAVQKEVALLRAQESSLGQSIAQKQKQEAILVAGLEGLERSRAHVQALLSRMNSDRELFANTDKRLGQIADKFDSLFARSRELTDDYAVKLSGLDKSLAKMDHGISLIDADREALSANLDVLKKDRAAYALMLKQNSEQGRLLQSQVENLAVSNKKFTGALENMQSLDNRLQATLAAETAAIRKMAQEDAQTRDSLTASARALEDSIQELQSRTAQTRDTATEVGNLVKRQREQSDSLAAVAAGLEAGVEKSRQAIQTEIDAGARLGHAAQTLAAQADILKTRLDHTGSQGGEFEKLLDNQAARLKDLSAMARQLADEINENRRRGARLEVLLGEIQTLVDKPVVSQPERGPEAAPAQVEAGSTP